VICQHAVRVIAFAAIRAPAGLSQQVVFEWRHNGEREQRALHVWQGRFSTSSRCPIDAYVTIRPLGAVVGIIENRWRNSITRREALLSLAGILAGAPLLYGPSTTLRASQLDPRPLKDHKRIPGLDEMTTAFDFEPICFSNMTLRNYDYMAHGADSEFTLRRNRQAFEWVELIERPAPSRVEGPGVSPATVETAREVLGLQLAVPILVAPSTRQRDLHPEGDAGMYQGATAASKTPIPPGAWLAKPSPSARQEMVNSAARWMVMGPSWIAGPVT